MKEMISIGGHRNQDSSAAWWRTFCPPAHKRPSWELARWLWLLTPAGAPVVRVLQGDRPPPYPGCVPYLGSDIRGWPREQRDAALGNRLPGDPVARKPGSHAPRRGKPRWEMEAAFWYDINGESEGDIAQRLELTSDTGLRPEPGDSSRSVRRYLRQGRSHLSAMNAWPWCLAPRRGCPPHEWWIQEHYLAPLARWHRLAFVNVANDLLATIEIATDSHNGERVSRERWVAAQRLYADWLGDG